MFRKEIKIITNQIIDINIIFSQKTYMNFKKSEYSTPMAVLGPDNCKYEEEDLPDNINVFIFELKQNLTDIRV